MADTDKRIQNFKKLRACNPQYDNITILKKQLNTGQISKATYIEKVNDIKNYKMGAVVLVIRTVHIN